MATPRARTKRPTSTATAPKVARVERPPDIDPSTGRLFEGLAFAVVQGRTADLIGVKRRAAEVAAAMREIVDRFDRGDPSLLEQAADVIARVDGTWIAYHGAREVDRRKVYGLCAALDAALALLAGSGPVHLPRLMRTFSRTLTDQGFRDTAVRLTHHAPIVSDAVRAWGNNAPGAGARKGKYRLLCELARAAGVEGVTDDTIERYAKDYRKALKG